MKHTQGPWKKVSKSVQSKSRNICTMSIDDEECRANSKLIVAAPEMLEALERAAAIFENRLEYVITMKPIYDAIKKAKGE